jgi:hypothetical protein
LCEDACVSEIEPPEPESVEHRVDLTGLTKLSDRPPPPKGERAIRVARGLSVLLLAIAAAGLPWYLVTRGGNDKPKAGGSVSVTPSASPTATSTAKASAYEVFNVGKACLNIRQDPSTSAVRIDCLTNGYRLTSDGKTEEAEGRLWRHVYDKLKKMWGWAADQYLKPAG